MKSPGTWESELGKRERETIVQYASITLDFQRGSRVSIPPDEYGVNPVVQLPPPPFRCKVGVQRFNWALYKILLNQILSSNIDTSTALMTKTYSQGCSVMSANDYANR